MASMKDVAKLAGVSVSTVSRVVNSNFVVEETTRRKVEDAIKKVNYKPNLLARGLRSKSGHMIGLAVPEILHQTFTHFIKYTEESAVKNGLNLIIGNTHNNAEIEEDFIISLLQRNIDGIILSRVSDKSRILHIVRDNVPFVVLDRALEVEDIPTVILNNFHAGELAAEHLIGLGHKKIGCVTGPLDIALSRDRLNGFKSVLKSHEIELPDNMIYEGDFKYQSGVDAIDYFLHQRINLSAIWAQSDLMAIGIMNRIRKANIQIPRDFSILGMDNISFSEIKSPPLTTIAQPYEKMCQTAIDMLIKQKAGKQLERMKEVLKPELIIRETTARYTKPEDN